MIKSKKEYDAVVGFIKRYDDVIKNEKDRLKNLNIPDNQIDVVMQPYFCKHESMKESVREYEQFRDGKFPDITNLSSIGRLLVAIRIYKNISQRELAEKLGISPTTVSRNEFNEYHEITVIRIQEVMEALGATLVSTIEL